MVARSSTYFTYTSTLKQAVCFRAARKVSHFQRQKPARPRQTLELESIIFASGTVSRKSFDATTTALHRQATREAIFFFNSPAAVPLLQAHLYTRTVAGQFRERAMSIYFGLFSEIYWFECVARFRILIFLERKVERTDRFYFDSF